MKGSKWTCNSSKLASPGTAGGPTVAAPTQARRAAERQGAAWAASQPCAHGKLNPPLPFPGQALTQQLAAELPSS